MIKKITASILITIAGVGLIQANDGDSVDKLLNKLTDTYEENRNLIHKKTLEDSKESLDLLTNNYVDHLDALQMLSDEKVSRELKNQKVSYLTEQRILSNHIVNLYERENGLIKKHARNRKLSGLNGNVDSIAPQKMDWNEVTPFIVKTYGMLSRLHQTMGLAESLKGHVDSKILHKYAYQVKRNYERIDKIVDLDSGFENSRNFYVLGDTYLAKWEILKKEHQFFVKNITEVNNNDTRNFILNTIHGSKNT